MASLFSHANHRRSSGPLRQEKLKERIDSDPDISFDTARFISAPERASMAAHYRLSYRLAAMAPQAALKSDRPAATKRVINLRMSSPQD